MVLVADEPEVVVGEVEDRANGRVELHARERTRVAPELGVGLVQVVEIQVRTELRRFGLRRRGCLRAGPEIAYDVRVRAMR